MSAVVLLENEHVQAVRNALLIDLACYGQVEEVRNAAKVRQICGESVPDDLIPLHPTACATVVTQFSDALRFLEILQDRPQPTRDAPIDQQGD